jgi:hypothetical protein
MRELRIPGCKISHRASRNVDGTGPLQRRAAPLRACLWAATRGVPIIVGVGVVLPLAGHRRRTTACRPPGAVVPVRVAPVASRAASVGLRRNHPVQEAMPVVGSPITLARIARAARRRPRGASRGPV